MAGDISLRRPIHMTEHRRFDILKLIRMERTVDGPISATRLDFKQHDVSRFESGDVQRMRHFDFG